MEDTRQTLCGVLLHAAREVSLLQHLLYPSSEGRHDVHLRGRVTLIHRPQRAKPIASDTCARSLALNVAAEGQAVKETLGNRIEVARVAQVREATHERSAAARTVKTTLQIRRHWLPREEWPCEC